MTPRNWGVGGWLVASAVLLVAAGVGVGLLVWNRQYFLLALAVVTSHYLAYKLPNRNLIAELEAARARKDTAIKAGMGVAFQVQELERRISGEHPQIEVEPFMADSQRCVWCHQPRHDGMCRRDDLPDRITEAYAAESGRIKGTGGVVPSSTAMVLGPDDGCVFPPRHTFATNVDGEWVDISDSVVSMEITTGRPADVEHLGQACAYAIRADQDCGEPADRWVLVGGYEWWLCARHHDLVIERGETDIDPCQTCGGTGMVPATGNGSDGFDRCPTCSPVAKPPCFDGGICRYEQRGMAACDQPTCALTAYDPAEIAQLEDPTFATGLPNTAEDDASDGPRILPTPRID